MTKIPKYTYRCFKCNHVFDELTTISGRNDPQECPECQEKAPRDVEAELADMGDFDETCKEHERWSWSMGVNRNQIAEMTRKYPGSEYHPSTGQLKIKSRNHKLLEMRRRNFEEYA